jgi:hypothetical protein
VTRPLCIDLFCGLGGWTEGFLAEGFDVIGFDIERHVYGEHRYPAQLVLQDVRTIHGAQFRDAAIIVASSPCQAYSYMAMPWTRAKQIAAALRGEGEFPQGYMGARTVEELNDLFEQPARIQREASEAAGRYIPMVQENVKGAQPWVGPAAWHYGSFYLWGDVPALMPIVGRRVPMKAGIAHRADGITNFHHFAKTGQTSPAFNRRVDEGTKNTGGSWFNIGSPGQRAVNRNPVHGLASRHADGGKGFTPSGEPLGKNQIGRKHGSKSKARKAASARIAKIPFPLAQWIAHVTRTAQERAA